MVSRTASTPPDDGGSEPPPDWWTPLVSSRGAGRCRMGQERGQFTDEFKTEAVALLASSGRPLVADCRRAGHLALDAAQLAQSPGRAACGVGGARETGVGHALRCGSGGRDLPASPRERPPAHGARHLKKGCGASSRKRRDEVPPDRRSAGCLAGARHVRCARRIAVGLLRLAITAGKPAQDRQSRTAERYPAGSCRAPGPIWGAPYSCRTACRGPECQPQAGRAGHAPAWHPGSRATALSCVHDRQQAYSADRGQPARPEIRGREA